MVKRREDRGARGGAACVYLLHFPDRSHYIGFTESDPVLRLRRHLGGRGSGWVRRHMERVGSPTIGAVVWFVTIGEAFLAERRMKRYRRPLERACSMCRGLGPWGPGLPEEVGNGKGAGSARG